MKPSILIVHPPNVGNDELIDQFCRRFANSHFVYLLRPCSDFRDDSPCGVRYLNNPLSRLPSMNGLAAVVTVGESQVAERLKEQYPHADHRLWGPVIEEDFTDGFEADLTASKIVEGDFSKVHEDSSRQAMYA